MSCIRNSILLLVTVGALQVNSITSSFAAEQSVVKKSDCTRVGGTLRPSGFKPTDKYQYICTYSDKYDRKCRKQMDDESAYYDLEQKKCVSEMMCELYFEC